MNWLEVSLVLNGELAEAVADVLARYASQGVAIESTAIESNPDDEGRPVGPVRVRAYLPSDDASALESARAKLEQDLFYLGMIQPIPQPEYTRVADADWAELWKANYKPVRVGNRLAIIPAWLADSTPDTSLSEFPVVPSSSPLSPSIRLLMDPGMAFGTGAHPTTQLCLALLETHVRPGDKIFDVGCGSGILSVAAVKLGAAFALAVDIDPEAECTTRENAALNGVSNKIEFRLGSIETALAPRDSNLQLPTSNFQVVVANILARVIINLLTEGLARTLAPSGLLILSGILAEQEPSVVDALRSAGCKVVEQRQSGDWIALAAKLVTT